MKIINQRAFEGRNIYSHRKCIRMDVDLEGYCEIPTKDIPFLNEKILELVPELYTHRCGIDEEGGFVKRLNEGTYLSHVCEHIIIAISNTLGMDVRYGKAREISGDRYYIIYEYQLKNTALFIGTLAVDIINSFIKNKQINFENRIQVIESIMREECMGPSTEAIANAAKDKGLPVMQLGSSGMYQIGYGKRSRRFCATIGNNTNGIAIDISCDKLLTKELLDIQNIPVADGEKVFNTLQLLESAERIGYPVVLKPQYGNQGKGVVVNIQNEKQLLKAYKDVTDTCKDVIVEKFATGLDYRVCVVNNKVIAVSLRMPPYIIGNGKNTIEELIKEMNQDPNRGESHEKPLTKIKIENNLLQCLAKQNLDINSVLKANERVFLRENANLSTGGSAEDCTDLICKENIDLCERTAKTLGLDICGIDICTKDIRIPLQQCDGIIVEVNAAPGIRMHHYPSKGKSRDVATAILSNMFNNDYSNIPVISVTGTNGKTTTVRLISYVLSLIGYTVGTTTTDGTYINDKCIHIGDDTGVESAKSILVNRDVDVAVLETARGGMIKRGLAYDLANVGVITNITEDHLGIDGINTLNDLSHVKSLVLEAVQEDGYAVINGDDTYSVGLIENINHKKIIFSVNKNNKYLQDNIVCGNPVVYLENDIIVVENRGKKYNICRVQDMPCTKQGNLQYNISNALAACSALVGIDTDYCIISKGFREFKLDEKHNIGRFNEFNVNDVKIILDYGHNIEGYRAVINGLKNMEYNNITAVVGVPGDRSNDSIVKIGEICGTFFKNIIIKEDLDRRGRNKGEVSELLKKGIEKTKHNLEYFDIVLDEVEALKKALVKANKGDTIIVFFEDYYKLYNHIKLLQNKELLSSEVAEL